MGINETLALRLDGGNTIPLTDGEVSDVLEAIVTDERDKARKEKAKQRERLYVADAAKDMEAYVRSVFHDEEVIDKRLIFAEKAQANNVTRRVVNEESTLYLPPTIRSVDGAANNANYLAMLQLCDMQIAMREASRRLNLHNDIWLMFRVRDEGHRRMPVIDLWYPGTFSVIPHPEDRTLAVGIILEWVTGLDPDSPHFRALTHGGEVMLDSGGRAIWSTRKESPFPRIPGMLVHKVPPSIRGAVLDSTSGGELINAHLDVWFEDILLLKESKSLNNQVMFSGDTSTTPTGQSQDSEADGILGEGVIPTTINRGVDLQQFRDTGDHIEERAAGNRGIPPSILRHQGASSGHEIELRMLPLMVQREQMIEIFRPVEREFVEIQAMVIAKDLPDLAFTTDGHVVNFGEIKVPRSAQERTAVFVADRGAGLTTTEEETVRRDPDLSPEQAKVTVKQRIDREVQRNEWMRPLMAISGSMANENPMVAGKPNGAAGSGDDGGTNDARALALEVLGAA